MSETVQMAAKLPWSMMVLVTKFAMLKNVTMTEKIAGVHQIAILTKRETTLVIRSVITKPAIGIQETATAQLRAERMGADMSG